MLKKEILISTEAPSRYVSNYTIGFARLSGDGGDKDASSAGSGSLVTVDDTYGVLTAAHVFEKLPSKGEVGIILRADGQEEYKSLKLTMEHVEPPVIFKGESFGPLGPDLAFMRLPEPVLGWLKATSSFFSLSQRRADVLARKASSDTSFDSITGVVHELTRETESGKPGVRHITFSTIYCGVQWSAMRYLQDYDLRYYQISSSHEPSFKVPESFEGVSGGAIWRFYWVSKEGKPSICDQRILAVPFYQSMTEGKREIVCHGPESIYGALIDAVRERWP